MCQERYHRLQLYLEALANYINCVFVNPRSRIPCLKDMKRKWEHGDSYFCCFVYVSSSLRRFPKIEFFILFKMNSCFWLNKITVIPYLPKLRWHCFPIFCWCLVEFIGPRKAFTINMLFTKMLDLLKGGINLNSYGIAFICIKVMSFTKLSSCCYFFLILLLCPYYVSWIHILCFYGTLYQNELVGSHCKVHHKDLEKYFDIVSPNCVKLSLIS